MKITELISILQSMNKVHGDLDVRFEFYSQKWDRTIDRTVTRVDIENERGYVTLS